MRFLNNKKITIVLIFVVMVNIFSNVFAVNNFITDTNDKITPSGSAEITTVKDKIWGSVKLVLQIMAISAILASGIRYMFASADQKADIKKSLIAIVIGATIVFGTTLVIDFVTTVAGQAMGT